MHGMHENNVDRFQKRDRQPHNESYSLVRDLNTSIKKCLQWCTATDGKVVPKLFDVIKSIILDIHTVYLLGGEVLS